MPDQRELRCADCKGDYEVAWYALHDHGGLEVKTLCLDCWVIEYGKGKIDEETEVLQAFTERSAVVYGEFP